MTVVLLILAVDWAALHDIIQGSEPSYWQEWTWLIVSTLLLAGVAWHSLRRRRTRPN